MRICCSLVFIAGSFSSENSFLFLVSGDLTLGLADANQVLSSLSYMPCCKSFVSRSRFKRYLLYVNMKYSTSLRFYFCIYTNWSNSFDLPAK